MAWHGQAVKIFWLYCISGDFWIAKFATLLELRRTTKQNYGIRKKPSKPTISALRQNGNVTNQRNSLEKRKGIKSKMSKQVKKDKLVKKRKRKVELEPIENYFNFEELRDEGGCLQ